MFVTSPPHPPPPVWHSVERGKAVRGKGRNSSLYLPAVSQVWTGGWVVGVWHLLSFPSPLSACVSVPWAPGEGALRYSYILCGEGGSHSPGTELHIQAVHYAANRYPLITAPLTHCFTLYCGRTVWILFRMACGSAHAHYACQSGALSPLALTWFSLCILLISSCLLM